MDNPPAITPDDDAIAIADEEDSPEHSHSVSASLFSGPIPPPALMSEYAEIDPEFPRRFIEIFERQQAHDHEVEKAVISNNKEIILNNQNLLKRGQFFGFVLALVGLVGGLIASFLGSPSRQHNRSRRPRPLGRSSCLQQKKPFFFTFLVSCASVTSASRRRPKRMNELNISGHFV